MFLYLWAFLPRPCGVDHVMNLWMENIWMNFYEWILKQRSRLATKSICCVDLMCDTYILYIWYFAKYDFCSSSFFFISLGSSNISDINSSKLYLSDVDYANVVLLIFLVVTRFSMYPYVEEIIFNTVFTRLDVCVHAICMCVCVRACCLVILK